MPIRRLQILNYRGVAERDITFPPGGAIAAGENGKGKTTIVRAIRAALSAQDIAPDAIREGADRAEILLDLDDINVRRLITEKTSSVTVKRGDMVAAQPQTFLRDLLGTSPLDPLDLFLLKGKERRAKVLEALPVTASLADLRKYAPELPDDFDVKGHGLEVLDRARKIFYDRRTEANRSAKEAERAAKEAATTAAAATPDDADLNVPGAILAGESAKAAVVMLHQRKQDAEAAEARTASTRDRIAKMRGEAGSIIASAAILEDVTALGAARDAACAEVDRLVEEHRQAEKRLVAAADAYDAALRKAHEETQRQARATELRAQADELETAVAAVAAPPSEVEIAAAQTAYETALATVASAKRVEEGRLLRAKAMDANRARDLAQSEADRLDTIVKALTDDAPSALLSAANGIPGLTLDGDDVLFEGKRLDVLCGAEQIDIAVEVAKRANAKSKILIVDGLEKLDPKQMKRFVSRATADGFQLIGTRVAEGEVVIEAIEPDEDATGKEEAAQ